MKAESKFKKTQIANDFLNPSRLAEKEKDFHKAIDEHLERKPPRLHPVEKAYELGIEMGKYIAGLKQEKIEYVGKKKLLPLPPRKPAKKCPVCSFDLYDAQTFNGKYCSECGWNTKGIGRVPAEKYVCELCGTSHTANKCQARKDERPTQRNATIECKAMEIYQMGWDDAQKGNIEVAKAVKNALIRINWVKGLCPSKLFQLTKKETQTIEDFIKRTLN